ncbi:MAG: hypothetical protein ACP5HZ_12765 [Ferrimicrobium sp.]
MTYDLRKLRLKGLITRIPHTNSYTLTPEGVRFAITYTKLAKRVFPPLLAANTQPAPIQLQRALKTIENYIDSYLDSTRLKTAA